jgi:hypothetical protein
MGSRRASYRAKLEAVSSPTSLNRCSGAPRGLFKDAAFHGSDSRSTQSASLFWARGEGLRRRRHSLGATVSKVVLKTESPGDGPSPAVQFVERRLGHGAVVVAP